MITYESSQVGAVHKHARIQRVLSEGSNLDKFFFFFFFFFFVVVVVDEGREDPNTTIINGVSLA